MESSLGPISASPTHERPSIMRECILQKVCKVRPKCRPYPINGSVLHLDDQQDDPLDQCVREREGAARTVSYEAPIPEVGFQKAFGLGWFDSCQPLKS